MKLKRAPFVFTPGLWICACLALAAASLASCTYTLPLLDDTAVGGAGGAGGSMCGSVLTHCEGTCVDTTSDPAHCGACNAACMPGLDCINSQCIKQNPPCSAGMTEPCYNGPSATENVGTCRDGLRTCSVDETGYGPCLDAVVPIPEICGNSLDDDCNGAADDAKSCLTNDGLVVRYFLNEAARGQGPKLALDSADDPLHLTINYGGVPNMNYMDASTGRGLTWFAPGLPGAAFAPVDGTKVFDAFQGKTQGTIEVVVLLQAITPAGSRIVTIGAGAESGRFTLFSNSADRVQFRWLNDTVAGDWPLSFGNSGRCVLHVVLDSTQADPSNRVLLYVNGTVVADNTGVPPNQNETIDIGPGRFLYLGNRESFMRSFGGSLHYAALYARPLAQNEIANHASRLITNDD